MATDLKKMVAETILEAGRSVGELHRLLTVMAAEIKGNREEIEKLKAARSK